MALRSQIESAAHTPTASPTTSDLRSIHLLHTSNSARDEELAQAERAAAHRWVCRVANRHQCTAACGCAQPCPPGRHGRCAHDDHARDVADALELLLILKLKDPEATSR
ncbi:hypothetical protein [Nocardiopsis synnemataformans]|uniref:hypothetical protein n=1 Tax=Nocardiopsis synnemataformans TaxID=61305 RepID=UPI003EB7C711